MTADEDAVIARVRNLPTPSDPDVRQAVADLINLARRAITEREANIVEVAQLEAEVDQLQIDRDGDLNDAMAAAHMLHEQAHGRVPWMTCRADPCAHLGLEKNRGPARLTLVAGVR